MMRLLAEKNFYFKDPATTGIYTLTLHDAHPIYDSGKGIEPGLINSIFKPGVTSKKRGWGLGLSLAKRIIEDYHKGRIFVKSSVEGEGTTFCISLPKQS